MNIETLLALLDTGKKLSPLLFWLRIKGHTLKVDPAFMAFEAGWV